MTGDSTSLTTILSSIHVLRKLHLHPTLPFVLNSVEIEDKDERGIFTKRGDENVQHMQYIIMTIYERVANFAVENDNALINTVALLFPALAFVDNATSKLLAFNELDIFKHLQQLCNVTSSCVSKTLEEKGALKKLGYEKSLLVAYNWIGMCILVARYVHTYSTYHDFFRLDKARVTAESARVINSKKTLDDKVHDIINKVDTICETMQAIWSKALRKLPDAKDRVRLLVARRHSMEFMNNVFARTHGKEWPNDMPEFKRVIENAKQWVYTSYKGFDTESYTSYPRYKSFKDAFNADTPYKELGRGTFGVVIEAETKNGEVRAVKMCRVPTEKAYLSFIRERDIMRAMHALDPNRFVNVYGTYVVNARLTAVEMEFMDGGNAYDYICSMSYNLKKLLFEPRENAKYTIAFALYILCSVVSGVKAIHKAGIVHADIKLANILRKRDGTLKISDAGSSFTLNDEPEIFEMKEPPEKENLRDAVSRQYWCIYPPEYWYASDRRSVKGKFWPSRTASSKQPTTPFDKRGIDIWSVGAMFHIIYSIFFYTQFYVYSPSHYERMRKAAIGLEPDPTLHIQLPPSMIESYDNSPKRVQVSSSPFSSPTRIQRPSNPEPPPIRTEPIESGIGIQRIEEILDWNNWEQAIQDCVRLYDRSLDKLENLIKQEIDALYAIYPQRGVTIDPSDSVAKINSLVAQFESFIVRMNGDEKYMKKRNDLRALKEKELEKKTAEKYEKMTEAEKEKARKKKEEHELAMKKKEEFEKEKDKYKFKTVGELSTTTDNDKLNKMFGDMVLDGNVKLPSLEVGMTVNEYVLASTTDPLSIAVDLNVGL